MWRCGLDYHGLSISTRSGYVPLCTFFYLGHQWIWKKVKTRIDHRDGCRNVRFRGILKRSCGLRYSTPSSMWMKILVEPSDQDPIASNSFVSESKTTWFQIEMMFHFLWHGSVILPFYRISVVAKARHRIRAFIRVIRGCKNRYLKVVKILLIVLFTTGHNMFVTVITFVATHSVLM